MIRENVQRILKEIPCGVTVVAATKQRSVAEIEEAIAAGITVIGENYVQEAKEKYAVIGKKVQWHLIGHLQTNKVRQALDIFDLIQTIDSERLARKLNAESGATGCAFPVLIEVNIAREPQKSGVYPEEIHPFVEKISTLGNIVIQGLMTLGPVVDKPANLAPYFRELRRIYEQLSRIKNPKLAMKYLSMGMSDSYKVAIDEGANLVRIGTAIFGPRHP